MWYISHKIIILWINVFLFSDSINCTVGVELHIMWTKWLFSVPLQGTARNTMMNTADTDVAIISSTLCFYIIHAFRVRLQVCIHFLMKLIVICHRRDVLTSCPFCLLLSVYFVYDSPTYFPYLFIPGHTIYLCSTVLFMCVIDFSVPSATPCGQMHLMCLWIAAFPVSSRF